MGYEGFIAFKHLTRRRKTGFISIISMISVMGVAVGVMALIVVMAVMSGFDRDLKSKFVNVQPHLRIEKIGGIEAPDQVIDEIQSTGMAGLRSISSFVEGEAIIRSYSNAMGVVVKGVDAQREDLSVYQKHLTQGTLDLQDVVYTVQQERKFLFFSRKPKISQESIGSMVLGQSLASRLRVRVGDRVNLISPFKDTSETFNFGNAEVKAFVVQGIFRVGMNDFDSKLALINIKSAQALYHLGDHVSGISMRFQDVDQAEVWKQRLIYDLPGYISRSWYDLNHNFFQALEVERFVMRILLALIVLVATFNIVSTLIMVVMEKTKDIGILRAVGATRASIRKIFVIEGFSIGIFGVVLGAISGLVLTRYRNEVLTWVEQATGFELFPSSVYLFDKLPAQIIPQDVVLTVGFAMVASILAGLYPAHRAASLNPIEALRYE